MLDDTLTDLLRAAETSLDGLGWDQPPLLSWVAIGHQGVTTTVELEPAMVLEGHPALALLRHRPAPPADAVGVMLVNEGWTYGPALADAALAGEDVGVAPEDDPDRRELRVAQLVLRDGTESVLGHLRGEAPQPLEAAGGGLVRHMLRRCVGLPSHAPLPGTGLARRLALLWQVSTLLTLADAGASLPRPDDDQWGTFTVPGVGEMRPDEAQGWVAVARRWLDGERDAAALAGVLRDAAGRAEPCLPGAFPLVRGGDEVMLDRAMLEWADDELVCELVDLSVPDLGTTVVRAMDALDDRALSSLIVWFQRQEPGRDGPG